MQTCPRLVPGTLPPLKSDQTRQQLGDGLQADLATGRERQLTTGQRAERTKLDFRCPICRSAIGQASCLICAPRRQMAFRFCC